MQLLWTAPLLVAALVCARPGQADLLARWMVAVAGVLMLLAVWEYRLERPPWVGHIPSFLKVNDPVIAAVLDGSRRSSDGLYRVQTTYTTSLSSAEFRSEEHTSELQSLMRISYSVFCLKKKKTN